MYDGSTSTIERAIELAKSGTCSSIDDIRTQLRAERYSGVMPTVAGISVQTQLKKLRKQAREGA